MGIAGLEREQDVDKEAKGLPTARGLYGRPDNWRRSVAAYALRPRRNLRKASARRPLPNNPMEAGSGTCGSCVNVPAANWGSLVTVPGVQDVLPLLGLHGCVQSWAMLGSVLISPLIPSNSKEGNRIEGGWVYRSGAGGGAKRAKQVQAGIASRNQEVGTGSLDGAIPAGDVERGGKSARRPRSLEFFEAPRKHWSSR